MEYGAIEARGWNVPHPKVDPLEAAIVGENRSLEFIRSICSTFRTRFEKCLTANGSHLEKQLSNTFSYSAPNLCEISERVWNNRA